ncbi:MAG: glucose-6-phosphate dehydrogenase, partial [Acidobacteria bacterium]|nr:glucose-6-phosphate dehydrogenase [Acidobacteriota bacterium]
MMIIFGATGDLTKRKLFPALYHLAKDGFLPENFAIIGVGRQELSTETFRSQIISDLVDFVGKDAENDLVKWFEERTYYTGGDFDDDKSLFSDIKTLLGEVTETHSIPENYFYYLAIPPSLFADVAQKIYKNDLSKQNESNWRRFIFEKPFGRDLDSAKQLNASLLEILDEDQIYRIDHYLGKETVQNILVFRFGNGLFEPIWNRNYINQVQITVAESIGVGSRGGYYDQSGALRDMVQNH